MGLGGFAGLSGLLRCAIYVPPGAPMKAVSNMYREKPADATDHSVTYICTFVFYYYFIIIIFNNTSLISIDCLILCLLCGCREAKGLHAVPVPSSECPMGFYGCPTSVPWVSHWCPMRVPWVSMGIVPVL